MTASHTEQTGAGAADSLKDMPIFTRVWLLGLAAILAVVAGYGLWRIQREYPSHWATILGGANSERGN
jgi:hypothetical protein